MCASSLLSICGLAAVVDCEKATRERQNSMLPEVRAKRATKGVATRLTRPFEARR